MFLGGPCNFGLYTYFAKFGPQVLHCRIIRISLKAASHVMLCSVAYWIMIQCDAIKEEQFCGDVVLDSVNIAFRDEDINLEKNMRSKFFFDFSLY